MTTQSLQGALQQSIRSALGCANDFNGDLHAMCDWYGVPAAPISGRLISVANKFDASITTASSALNYFLQNYLSAVPTLALDFTSGSLDSRVTFTRGSQATLFDSTGTLVFAPNNVIRNNTMVGAVAGTPGTAPTNWTLSLAGGLSREIVGVGTANGINYIDIRIFGTTTNTNLALNVRFEPTTQIAALTGQTWTESVWVQMVGGTTSGISYTYLTVVEQNGAGADLAYLSGSSFLSTISTFTRRTSTVTTANASTAFVCPSLWVGNTGIGAAIDITLRIGMPQLERGSVATAVNATSGTAYYGPRFDYDPSTLAARGLLIEEARTNVYIYSEELNNAAWTANGVTVSADAGVSPTGATTADNVIPTAVASTFKEVQQNFSSTLGTTYTFSVFAKSNGYRYVQLVATSASFGNFAVNYDLDTGTETAYTAGTSTVLQRSITPIKNGWYRLSVSVTALATSATSRLSCDIIPASNSARGVSWTGDGTSGVLMWGMQVETGAFSTSYIPTTTTALTRSADVASMTGTNFSSWYNAVEGTIVTQAIGVNNVSGATRRFVEIGDGGVTERMIVGYSATTNTRLLVVDNNTTQADITVSTGVPAGSLVKMAAAYKVNDFQQASNNTLGTADASGTLPTVTTMFIGADINAATVAATLNGHIQRISYYPSRLADATLQALTA